MTPQQLAQLFHETYERLAPDFGYRTREASAKPWDEVPERNRALMVATCAEVLDKLTAKAEMPAEVREQPEPNYEVIRRGPFSYWVYFTTHHVHYNGRTTPMRMFVGTRRTAGGARALGEETLLALEMDDRS